MKTNLIERRILPAASCELRVDGDGDAPKIRGYAAVYNKRSEDLGGWFEVVAPGAFTESLANGDDVRALYEHESRGILGRRVAGTLGLTEDEVGLAVVIDPPDTSVGRDVVESIRRSDLTGMSFGFRTIDDRWETQGGVEVRTLEKVELFDVSIVAYPAYPDTSVGLRSLEMYQQSGGNVSTPKRNAAILRLAEVDTA